MILRQYRNKRRLIPNQDLFFIFYFLEDTMIWNNIYPAEAHQQCPKGTDQLKVWETLV